MTTSKACALPILITRVAICIFAVSQTMLSPLITRIGADFGLGLGGSGFLFTAYYWLRARSSRSSASARP